MIKAMIGNTVKREPYILDANTTLRAALEEAGVDYTRGTIQLDSAPWVPATWTRPLRTSASPRSATS